MFWALSMADPGHRKRILFGQVEYDGHPLYLYAGDSSLWEIEGSGNGTDGTWFAVTPDLKPAG